jgi:uridine kinase
MPKPAKPLCLAISGGSGSGKSWLAQFLKDKLGKRAVIVCQDWYYRDNAGLTDAESQKLNFDHPDSIEFPLFRTQLGRLLAGQTIEAPRYDYASHSRLKATQTVAPAPLIILDGLLILAEKRLRDVIDLSVFIEVPADERLVRRIRRDVEHRRVDLQETLRLYEHCVKPMHERFIAPSAAHATWIWRQVEDKRFPEDLLKTVRAKLDAVTA